MDLRKLKNTPGARKAKVPSFIPPQLATLVKEPPSGDEWLHETEIRWLSNALPRRSWSRPRLEPKRKRLDR
jgi:hypothetical protein